jgi:uncharacterized membrane protein YgdD (TMEM256/DUF423 family)
LNIQEIAFIIMDRTFLSIGALSAFLAVGLGAFGAHILKKHLSTEMLSVFETGVRYQMYHSLGLILVVIALKDYPGKWIAAVAWLFIVGIILFSGSLYALSTSGIKWLGAITPLGGLAFLAGWASLATAVWKGKG